MVVGDEQVDGLDEDVDGQLGQLPIEFGPLFLLRKRLAISRWGTLAAKWMIMLIIAAVQAGMFLLVCAMVGTSSAPR